MNVQNLINELTGENCPHFMIDAAGVAFTNAGDTVGPQNFMTSVSEDYAQCFIGTIQGMLCDPSDYGISAEVVAWFKARGIRG